ncbi:hypothetical protein [Pontibacter sp. H249]|uniref:hypothetical protein n=1 Tax=Pontibacter sp. H249 TaxID=3133420 RepID=UPI0030BE0447
MHNNILLGTNTSEVVLPAPQSSITHNIAALSQFGTENNNQANVAPTNIFIGGESPDGQYQIKENGPADNTGRNGVDIGAFGGPAPYRLSGIPNIPHIYELTTDGFATEAGELKVQIKVNAN